MGFKQTQIRLTGRGFDLARRMLDVTERCFLLQSIEGSKNLQLVMELEKWWVLEFNEWRTQFKLTYATPDVDFRDVINITSHVGYGLPGSIATYEILPDRRDLDIVPPTMGEPFWKVWAAASDRVFIL